MRFAQCTACLLLLSQVAVAQQWRNLGRGVCPGRVLAEDFFFATVLSCQVKCRATPLCSFISLIPGSDGRCALFETCSPITTSSAAALAHSTYELFTPTVSPTLSPSVVPTISPSTLTPTMTPTIGDAPSDQVVGVTESPSFAPDSEVLVPLLFVAEALGEDCTSDEQAECVQTSLMNATMGMNSNITCAVYKETSNYLATCLDRCRTTPIETSDEGCEDVVIESPSNCTVPDACWSRPPLINPRVEGLIVLVVLMILYFVSLALSYVVVTKYYDKIGNENILGLLNHYLAAVPLVFILFKFLCDFIFALNLLSRQSTFNLGILVCLLIFIVLTINSVAASRFIQNKRSSNAELDRWLRENDRNCVVAHLCGAFSVDALVMLAYSPFVALGLLKMPITPEDIAGLNKYSAASTVLENLPVIVLACIALSSNKTSVHPSAGVALFAGLASLILSGALHYHDLFDKQPTNVEDGKVDERNPERQNPSSGGEAKFDSEEEQVQIT